LGYKIREIETERKFCEELSLDALIGSIPPHEIEAVLREADAFEQRHRRLGMIAVVLLIVELHIYSRLSIDHVFKRLGKACDLSGLTRTGKCRQAIRRYGFRERNGGEVWSVLESRQT
jgi:hypothetical protein